MNLQKIKNATIISCFALVALVLSSCNEDSVKPVESENNLNLPTVQAPATGWTAEELALISEFGGITEVTPSNDWISGLKLTANVEVEKGDPDQDCAGSVGWCSWEFKGFDVGWTWDDVNEVGVKITFVDNIPGVRLETPTDSIPGTTTHGLLPIHELLVMSSDFCDSLGVSTAVIYPGLYWAVPNDSNFVYVNGYFGDE